MLTCAVGGVLGVMLSVPLRRALVINSDLPYPEGVAGAEILRVGMAGDEGARENRLGLSTIVLGAVVAALPAASSASCGSRLQPVSARTPDRPRARIWMATIFIFRFSPVIAS